jgi:hypothetical protein
VYVTRKKLPQQKMTYSVLTAVLNAVCEKIQFCGKITDPAHKISVRGMSVNALRFILTIPSHLDPGLPSGLFSSGFPTNTNQLHSGMSVLLTKCTHCA